MKENIRFIAILLVVIWASLCFASAVQGQQVCISQEAANACAANTRELMAARDEIAVLKVALAEKDKSIADLKETNRLNVLDLTNRLNEVTAEAAHEKGRRVQLEADKVFWAEIVKIAIANTRKKCAGLSLIC